MPLNSEPGVVVMGGGGGQNSERQGVVECGSGPVNRIVVERKIEEVDGNQKGE